MRQLNTCMPLKDPGRLHLVWHAGAHNSHVGDARATDMGIRRGEVNVGQLLREHVGDRHPDLVANLGFTTHMGTVAAADDWNEPVKNKRVNPSLPGKQSEMQLALPHGTTLLTRLDINTCGSCATHESPSAHLHKSSAPGAVGADDYS